MSSALSITSAPGCAKVVLKRRITVSKYFKGRQAPNCSALACVSATSTPRASTRALLSRSFSPRSTIPFQNVQTPTLLSAAAAKAPAPTAPPAECVAPDSAVWVPESAAAGLLNFIPDQAVRTWAQAAVDILWPIALGYITIAVVNYLAARAQKIRSSLADVHTTSSAYVWSWVPLTLAPPLSVFIPIIAFLTSLERLAKFVDIANHRSGLEVPEWLDTFAHWLAYWVDKIGDRLIDLTTIGCIIFITWVFLQWKQLKIARYLQKKQNTDLERILIPASALADWVVAACTALFCFQIIGVDLRPLLAVGGVGSLLIGFSAQAILSNAVSGLSIFLSRPFLPGERITVVGSGNIMVSGVVQQVEPVRTVIQTDDGVPVRIPNKMIADLIIYNESRASDGIVGATSTWAGQGMLSRRLLRAHIKMPPGNSAAVTDLMLQLEEYLQDNPAVDILRGMSVALEGINEKGYDIIVRCCLLSATIAEQKRAASDLFIGISNIASKHNAITTSLPGVLTK